MAKALLKQVQRDPALCFVRSDTEGLGCMDPSQNPTPSTMLNPLIQTGDAPGISKFLMDRKIAGKGGARFARGGGDRALEHAARVRRQRQQKRYGRFTRPVERYLVTHDTYMIGLSCNTHDTYIVFLSYVA